MLWGGGIIIMMPSVSFHSVFCWNVIRMNISDTLIDFRLKFFNNSENLTNFKLTKLRPIHMSRCVCACDMQGPPASTLTTLSSSPGLCQLCQVPTWGGQPCYLWQQSGRVWRNAYENSELTCPGERLSPNVHHIFYHWTAPSAVYLRSKLVDRFSLFYFCQLAQ